MRIWTIGHSTLPIDEFLERLGAHGITQVADVRRFPGSRRHPHFGREPLQETLESRGCRYVSLPELGGRRRPRRDSHNTAWRNDAFRGYADYMETPAFEAAVEALIAIAETGPTAILCAEQLWWQCHRGLIADFLKAAGHEVLHITGTGEAAPHPFTSAAKVVNGRLRYTGAPLLD